MVFPFFVVFFATSFGPRTEDVLTDIKTFQTAQEACSWAAEERAKTKMSYDMTAVINRVDLVMGAKIPQQASIEAVRVNCKLIREYEAVE